MFFSWFTWAATVMKQNLSIKPWSFVLQTTCVTNDHWCTRIINTICYLTPLFTCTKMFESMFITCKQRPPAQEAKFTCFMASLSTGALIVITGSTYPCPTLLIIQEHQVAGDGVLGWVDGHPNYRQGILLLRPLKGDNWSTLGGLQRALHPL